MTRKCAVVISAKHLQRVAMKGFVEIKVLIDLNRFSQNRETACTVMQKKKPAVLQSVLHQSGWISP